jgi:hypothetical protein
VGLARSGVCFYARAEAPEAGGPIGLPICPSDSRVELIDLGPAPWATSGPSRGPTPGARRKDDLENALRQVCSGSMTLSDAQHAIASDWEAAYRRYVGTLS